MCRIFCRKLQGPCLILLLVLSRVVPALAGEAAAAARAAALAPAEYRSDVAKALAAAENNQPELFAAIQAVRPEHREGMAFLVAYMPPCDLKTLKKDFLIQNVEYAYKAVGEVPWGKDIPHELFLNDVLPYANVNERRDNWRKDFYERFMPVARQCKTAGEATLRLNKHVFETLKVKYHATKRPKPNQSPYESIEAGWASCTGLSILLIDACRAVGVPARFVGTPQWTSTPGNHSWVEVWDRQWRFAGAAETDALDKAGFVEVARKADAASPEHSIYAVSFRPIGVAMPLVWAPDVKWVHAQNVTPFYTVRRRVIFLLPGNGDLTLRLGGSIVARVSGGKEAALDLAAGETYSAEVRLRGKKVFTKSVSLSGAEGQTVVVRLDE